MDSAPPPPASTPDPIKNDGLNKALAITLAVVCLLITIRIISDQRTRPLELAQVTTTKQLNLNTATTGELTQLPGIGPQAAERIVKYREQNGPYQSVNDLKKVGGIGDRTINKLSPWLMVIPMSAENTKQLTPEPERLQRSSPNITASSTRTKTSSKSPTISKLNINTASLEELEALPGIGRVIAQRMVEVRNQKPFTTIDDLRRVSGIGVKRLDALRDLVTVAD